MNCTRLCGWGKGQQSLAAENHAAVLFALFSSTHTRMPVPDLGILFGAVASHPQGHIPDALNVPFYRPITGW